MFCEGKVLELTALASLPSWGSVLSSPPASWTTQPEPHLSSCLLSSGPETGSVCHMHPMLQQSTAPRSLSTVWSHGLMDERLVQTLSGCLEKSECDTMSGFLSPCHAERVSHPRAAVPLHILFAFTHDSLKEQKVKMHHHQLIFVAG